MRSLCFVAALSLPLLAQGAETAKPAAAAPARVIAPAPAFTAKQLAAPPTASWITNGGSLWNQRYSPLAAIDKDNVGNLKGVWRTHLESGIGPQFSGQGQPLFHDGVIYMVTGANDVFALDVNTGAILWRYDAHLDANRVKVCCGWVARGVGLGEGKVFVGQLDAKLVALDQKTGKVSWSIQAEDPLVGYSIASAPLYYEGLVITGFAGGDMGTRGRIKAYDAKSGKLKWTFYTIPAPGEPHFDGSWPKHNDAWKYGGAPIWQTPAVVPELGLLYFSTGNAAPEFNGAARAGDNLFTASILALEAKTGKYRWHFQQVRHDIWDYDSPNPVVLFDAPYGSVVRKGLAQVSKTGWVYLLDRATGKPLIGIEDRPVPQEPRQKTAATQPYVIGDPVVPQHVDVAPEGFELVNGGRIFTPFWDKVVVYKPQMAVNWPPSSYDPYSNYFFVCGIDNLASSRSDGRDFYVPTFTTMYMGGGGANTGAPRRGIFSAVDLKTNRLVWQQAWPEGCFSGSLNTKGGLLFVGRADGRFTALDKSTGAKLWEFMTDAGVNAPATSFEYRGQQYIAVMSAGTLFGGGRKGDSVWLFGLNGTIASLPPPRPGSGSGAAALGGPGMAPPPPEPVTLPTGAANLAEGRKLYVQFCMACHGESGTGGHGGGASLANVAKDIPLMAGTAVAGKGQNMPAFRDVLKGEQLRDVIGFIAQELFGPTGPGTTLPPLAPAATPAAATPAPARAN